MTLFSKITSQNRKILFPLTTDHHTMGVGYAQSPEQDSIPAVQASSKHHNIDY